MDEIEYYLEIVTPKKCPICGLNATIKRIPHCGADFYICKCSDNDCESHIIRERIYPSYIRAHNLNGAVVLWEDFVELYKRDMKCE